MQALGNDFVMLDFTQHGFEITAEIAAQIADRHFGIGCDQILIAEPSPADGIDFAYRILNADGSEVAQCGNGARCFAHFVRAKGLTDKDTITVKTLSGVMRLSIEAKTGFVRVDMGAPKLGSDEIPIAMPTAPKYAIDLASQSVELSAVSMGNPHAILQVDSVTDAPVAEIGSALQQHEAFPESVNVGFMHVQSASHINLRVFERGVGETLACGSGACAAVVAGIQGGLLEAEVTVSLPGGDVRVSWQGGSNPVILFGPATFVYTGVIEI